MFPTAPFRFPLARSRAIQCLIVTILYALLAWFALHAPIAANAPLAHALGGAAQARELAVAFVRVLVWPLGAILAVNLGRDLLEGLRRLRDAS